MSAVTRERVEELIEQQRDEFESNKDQAEHWQRGPRDLLTALTRLLALEDALKEAGPALEDAVHHFDVLATKREHWASKEKDNPILSKQAEVVDALQWAKEDRQRATVIRALAALGGDK